MTNTVELIGHYGGDLTHSLSAWTSTSRELTPEKQERIPALLKMLAEKGHETPFEKSTLHFLCTVDQATHIHLLKPRIGVSVNAESARFFKTMNSQLTLDVMFNFRSFVHFQRLRAAPAAQKEVRELAGEMLLLVKNIEGNPFEHTIKAFGL